MNLKSILLLVLLLFFLACKNDKVVEKQVVEETPQLENESHIVNGVDTKKTYSSAGVMPRFPGCEDKDIKTIEKYLCANKRLNNYISNRLRYPKVALNNRVEGTVTAQFVVRPDGLIDDISVHNDIGYGCGKTVLGIVESMNHMNERWTPGEISGVPVRVRVAVPVEFRLMID